MYFLYFMPLSKPKIDNLLSRKLSPRESSLHYFHVLLTDSKRFVFKIRIGVNFVEFLCELCWRAAPDIWVNSDWMIYQSGRQARMSIKSNFAYIYAGINLLFRQWVGDRSTKGHVQTLKNATSEYSYMYEAFGGKEYCGVLINVYLNNFIKHWS